MSLSPKYLSFNCTWNVVNVSLCKLKKYQGFFSPPLKSEALKNSEWYLKFTPDAGQNGEPSIEVARKSLEKSTSEDDKSTYKGIDYDLAFFSAGGTVHPEIKIFDALKTEFHFNDNLFLQRSQLYGKKEHNIQRKDELCVRFRIWARAMKTNYYLARTVLKQMKFLWNIRKTPTDFSPCVTKAFELPTLQFEVILDDFDLSHNCLNMSFNIFTTKRKIEEFAHCKISVIDAEGKEQQELFDFVASSELAPLNFRICTKPEYLVANKLPLQWQFTFGVNEIISNEPQQVPDFKACQASTASVFSETTVVPPCLKEDQLQRCSDKKLSDAILVAGGISFQVHSSLLRARSKVFCDLFSKRCQPKFPEAVLNINHINQEEVFHIDDLHPDTLDQMLLYIYTDTCKALQWKCAAKLYEAAYRYGIWELQQKCQSVLKSELSNSNACQILILATLHKDEDLVQCVKNFLCYAFELKRANLR